ncbi:MAG: solute carrier family 23 protein [bacterium]|nr:solute carrier family 23 protein [bacterium]
MAAEVRRGDLIYSVDDIPRPFGRAFFLGAQHVLTMFGATVSVPLLLGPAMGMNAHQIATLIGAVMLASGLVTLLQVHWGTRLPIVQGVSFSFLGPFFAIIGAHKGAGPATVMQYIAGAIMSGAVVEAAVGQFGWVGKLRRYISPVVIGPVIMLIGLALFKVGAPMAGLFWPISALVIICIFWFSQFLSRTSLVFRLFPILLAAAIGWGVSLLFSSIGTFDPKHPAYVNLAGVAASPWFRPPWGEGVGWIFPWGWPKFSLAFFLAILASYLASMIESFGDYHSVSYMSRLPDPSEQTISRGIRAEGVGCFFTGIFGGFSSTSYSENIGLIGITRVASRYVVTIGAFILIFFGIFAKFGALVATLPRPVVGAMYCALFGLIAAIGVQQVARADLRSDRNLLIIGFSLFMGLSLPAYFGGVPEMGFEARRVAIAWAPWLADMINIIGSTGMAVAAIFGLILDNLLPGTPEERGIKS